VKVGRKILREKVENNESTVFIPFGSEYSLLLKNLSGRNAVVHIEIDGKKVTKGGFYITAGQTAEIERFVESLTEGRRFRFIEKTEEISDFRGDRVDDGIIRVTWQFEKPAPEVKEIRYNYKHEHQHYNHYHHFGCNCWWCNPHHVWYGGITNTSIPLGGQNITYSASNSGGGGIQSSCFNAAIGANANVNRSIENLNLYKSAEPGPGITVEGSKSFQSFGEAKAGELENNIHSMVIMLKGFDDSKKYIKDPITVKHKRQCPTCGRKWKNSEFCGKCSTALAD